MIGFSTEEDTSRNILQKLDAIYERKSLATQLAVEKKLLSLKFKGDTPLTRHFIDFDEMVVELQAAGAKLNEMSKVARLLLTLSTSYDAVVTVIQTLSDDTLSLAFVKTRLLDYEIKLRNECGETSAKVLQTEVKRTTNNKIQINRRWKNFRPSFKQKLFNKHAQKFNHSNSQNFKEGPYNRNNKKGCEHCGRKNHEKINCFYYKKTLKTPEERPKKIQNVQIDGESESFAFMTGDGTLTDGQKNSTNKLQFRLDSGATDHLVNQLDFFTTMTELEVPLRISITKKNEAITAIQKGTIKVTTNLGVTGVLENFLYARLISHTIYYLYVESKKLECALFLPKLEK